MSPIKVSILIENFVGVANGVYTAYAETIEALKDRDEIKLSVNSTKPCDITHYHSIGPYYLWTSFSSKGTMVVTAHVIPESFVDSIILSRFWNPIARFYLRFAYNRSDVIQAVSPLVKQKLREIGVKKPIRIICNCVDRDKFRLTGKKRKKFRQKLGLRRDDFVAMSVGQIQPRKGIDTFIETAKQLPAIKFLWVGGQVYGRLTAHYRRMSQIVKEAPENVIFAGTVPFEDIPGYYNAADIFFFPSHQENFPFVLLEAASTGLPLLLRDNPEYELILAGRYLKAGSVDGFHTLIEKLLNDHDLFTSYQQHSLKLAKEYDRKSYAAKLIELYKSIYSN